MSAFTIAPDVKRGIILHTEVCDDETVHTVWQCLSLNCITLPLPQPQLHRMGLLAAPLLQPQQCERVQLQWNPIVTARNEVGAKLCFYRHLSFC